MSYPTKFFKTLTPVALAIILASCGGGTGSFKGGGDDSGDIDGGKEGEKEAVISSIELSANSHQWFSAGADPIVISAIGKDNNNNVIPGADITFSATSGALTTTSVDGDIVKSAEFSSNADKANRSITITASANNVSPKEISVDVVGTNMTADGPSNISIDKATEYSFKLRDSANNPIANTNIVITQEPDDGTITISPVNVPALNTGSDGEVTVSIVATQGGNRKLTATALGASISKAINISGNDFSLIGEDLNGDGNFDSKDLDLNIGTPEVITAKWLINNTPQTIKPISIRTTRGVIVGASTKNTDANGEATFTIQSDTAGKATVTVETSGGLITTLEREFVATTPKYLETQASPSLIDPNKISTIITKVRDNNDNPVKNVKVNYTVKNDSTNGVLSNSRAVTDSLGRAEITYTAGNASSALEGVTIETELHDFNTITGSVNLTVGEESKRIVLGRSAKIKSTADEVYYEQTYGIIVTDSAGNPIKGQKVDFSIASTHYYKGYLTYDVPNTVWVQSITATCPAEDFDHDGNLDAGEDVNSNNKLDPTQPATVSLVSGTDITDENGMLTIDVIYPKSEALWSTQRLTASITTNGTEQVEHTLFKLLWSTEDATADSLPPNVTIIDEDRNSNGVIDFFSEDANGNGQLDIGEDINNNGQLDINISEDLDENNVLDSPVLQGAYGSSSDCRKPN